MLASTLLAGCGGSGTAGQAAQASSGTSSSVPTQSSSGTPPTVSGGSGPTNKSADVSWTPPTTNTNGSALTDLAGYIIYYGTSTGKLTQTIHVPSAGATNYVVPGLTSGTWYFAVAAYTNTGLESTLSGVATKTIT